MHPNIKLPSEFLHLVETTMPTHLNMADFIAACQRPLRRSIRVNTLKIELADFKALATQKNWHLESIPWCQQGFWLEGT